VEGNKRHHTQAAVKDGKWAGFNENENRWFSRAFRFVLFTSYSVVV
jgi:hypothetical protein